MKIVLITTIVRTVEVPDVESALDLTREEEEQTVSTFATHFLHQLGDDNRHAVQVSTQAIELR